MDVFEYKRGTSTAGFIYHQNGRLQFFSIRGGTDSPAFLPMHCNVCSSTKGLLLCQYPANDVRRELLHQNDDSSSRRRNSAIPSPLTAYAVCNPYLDHSQRLAIPNPPGDLHCDAAPRVLVVDKLQCGRYSFTIVCIITFEDLREAFRFNIFSSATGAWRQEEHRLHEDQILKSAMGDIKPETGVACNKKAFWLFKSYNYVLCYDTAGSEYFTIDIPDTFMDLPSPRIIAQLGVYQGTELCLVGQARDKHDWKTLIRAVFTYDQVQGTWVCKLKQQESYRCKPPVLSGFDDCRVQVPFWKGRRLTIHDCTLKDEKDPPCSREWPAPSPSELGGCILPLLRTRLRPGLDFPRL